MQVPCDKCDKLPKMVIGNNLGNLSPLVWLPTLFAWIEARLISDIQYLRYTIIKSFSHACKKRVSMATEWWMEPSEGDTLPPSRFLVGLWALGQDMQGNWL